MAGRDLTMGPLPHSVRLVCRTIRRPIQNLLPGMCLALVSVKVLALCLHLEVRPTQLLRRM